MSISKEGMAAASINDRPQLNDENIKRIKNKKINIEKARDYSSNENSISCINYSSGVFNSYESIVNNIQKNKDSFTPPMRNDTKSKILIVNDKKHIKKSSSFLTHKDIFYFYYKYIKNNNKKPSDNNEDNSTQTITNNSNDIQKNNITYSNDNNKIIIQKTNSNNNNKNNNNNKKNTATIINMDKSKPFNDYDNVMLPDLRNEMDYKLNELPDITKHACNNFDMWKQTRFTKGERMNNYIPVKNNNENEKVSANIYDNVYFWDNNMCDKNINSKSNGDEMPYFKKLTKSVGAAQRNDEDGSKGYDNVVNVGKTCESIDQNTNRTHYFKFFTENARKHNNKNIKKNNNNQLLKIANNKNNSLNKDNNNLVKIFDQEGDYDNMKLSEETLKNSVISNIKKKVCRSIEGNNNIEDKRNKNFIVRNPFKINKSEKIDCIEIFEKQPLINEKDGANGNPLKAFYPSSDSDLLKYKIDYKEHGCVKNKTQKIFSKVFFIDKINAEEKKDSQSKSFTATKLINDVDGSIKTHQNNKEFSSSEVNIPKDSGSFLSFSFNKLAIRNKKLQKPNLLWSNRDPNEHDIPNKNDYVCLEVNKFKQEDLPFSSHSLTTSSSMPTNSIIYSSINIASHQNETLNTKTVQKLINLKNDNTKGNENKTTLKSRYFTLQSTKKSPLFATLTPSISPKKPPFSPLFTSSNTHHTNTTAFITKSSDATTIPLNICPSMNQSLYEDPWVRISLPQSTVSYTPCISTSHFPTSNLLVNEKVTEINSKFDFDRNENNQKNGKNLLNSLYNIKLKKESSTENASNAIKTNRLKNFNEVGSNCLYDDTANERCIPNANSQSSHGSFIHISNFKQDNNAYDNIESNMVFKEFEGKREDSNKFQTSLNLSNKELFKNKSFKNYRNISFPSYVLNKSDENINNLPINFHKCVAILDQRSYKNDKKDNTKNNDFTGNIDKKHHRETTKKGMNNAILNEKFENKNNENKFIVTWTESARNTHKKTKKNVDLKSYDSNSSEHIPKTNAFPADYHIKHYGVSRIHNSKVETCAEDPLEKYFVKKENEDKYILTENSSEGRNKGEKLNKTQKKTLIPANVSLTTCQSFGNPQHTSQNNQQQRV